jgi:hypothetical protein
LATDQSLSDAYDPSLVTLLLGETAWLLRHLGFTAQHTILIGGVVPSLLVLDPPAQPHLGTTDLDLCLSLAIVTGDTAEYERLETALTAAGYEPTDASFRWRQRDGLHLEVEFFCAASDDRPAGRLFRPKASINPTAKHNFGPKLTAVALDAGGVIEADAYDVEVDVDLPDAAGRTRFTFRVTGLLGFLVAKTAALTGRDKPKDAYDIVWIIENWPGGPAAAATALRDSPAFHRSDAAQMVDRLFEEFSSLDRLGPSSFVRFLAPATASQDERVRLARQALGAVNELQTALVQGGGTGD